MLTRSGLLKPGALLMSGAALGGAGGYAASASGTSAARVPSAMGARARARGAQGRLRRAVSITAVVPAGNGRFATISIRRGTLVSSSPGTITLREGTPKAIYRTESITLPSNVRVRLARKPSSLESLRAGDRVIVVEGPRRTTVSAQTARVVRAAKAAGAQAGSPPTG